MWAFLVAIIPLLTLLFQEFFSAQAKAEEQKKQFILDQASLKLIVDAALDKWLSRAAQDSKGAGDAWDNADNDGKGK